MLPPFFIYITYQVFHIIYKREWTYKRGEDMGYQLPIQPIQSEMYANRMNADFKNFAYINRVQKVKLDTGLMSKFQNSLEQEIERLSEKDRGVASVSNSKNMSGFITPNPMNLSPEIAGLVGKGLVVNRYV